MEASKNRVSVLPMPDPKLDQLIRRAIQRRRLLRLRYRNRERITEPHDYGILDGSVKLFTFQIAGSSSKPLPNWRMMFVAEISDAQIMDQTFPGGRPTPSGKHYQWDKLFARVKPAPQQPKRTVPKSRRPKS